MLAYMDDLLILTVTMTVEEKLQLLAEVLKLTKNAEFKLNLEKCTFMENSLKHLGHEILAEEIRLGRR